MKEKVFAVLKRLKLHKTGLVLGFYPCQKPPPPFGGGEGENVFNLQEGGGASPPVVVGGGRILPTNFEIKCNF